MKLQQYLTEFRNSGKGGDDPMKSLEDIIWARFVHFAAVKEDETVTLDTSFGPCVVKMVWGYHSKKSFAKYISGAIHITVGMDNIPVDKHNVWFFEGFEKTFRDLIRPAIDDFYSDAKE